MDTYLKENFQSVEARIQAACDRAGRSRKEVTLIAVSKTKPVEMIKEEMDCYEETLDGLEDKAG